MSSITTRMIDEMKRTGFVPLYTPSSDEEAFQIVKTAYDAGLRTFEVTIRKPNSFDVFKYLQTKREAFPDMLLGAGTVMDEEMAKKIIDAGADFIVSPILKNSVGVVCHRYGKPWIPGCATLTEIVTAKENGAEVIKVFPGSVLGPGFIAAITPVVPGLQLMVTGGVEPTEQNLSAWYKAGAMCVGLGSQLFSKEIIAKKDWNGLAKNITDAIALIRKVRQPV